MKISTNYIFIDYILNEVSKEPEFNEEMRKLLNGKIILKNGCFLLSSLNAQSHYSISDFEDEIAYECFINSIHIDDYVKSNFLKNSINVISEITKIWLSSKFSKLNTLMFILTKNEYGINIKFHVERNKKYFLKNELNNYDQPIMVIKIPN